MKKTIKAKFKMIKYKFQLDMENKPTVGTLNEKILDILDEGQEWDKQTPDTIILEFQKVANSIEQLILDEIGKAWDAGHKNGTEEMQQAVGRKSIHETESSTKEEYLQSIK